VAATRRNTQALDDLFERYADRLWVAALDVRDPQAVRETVDRAFAELGRIDTIVSNAGYGVLGAAKETTDAQLRDIVDTNLIGSIVLIRSGTSAPAPAGRGTGPAGLERGRPDRLSRLQPLSRDQVGHRGICRGAVKGVGDVGIRLTLVEPGPARTNFGRGLAQPEPIAAYDGTPAHQTRDALLSGDWVVTGDPERMADAMISVADQPDPPLRLVLGGTSYNAVRDALAARLDELEAQREIAFSTDYPAEELA
jgi:NAD(P)-dependent dehydrogenase (short-subunit alcohol dehydrogenase family)